MSIHLLWGCDSNRQFECYWLNKLLGDKTISSSFRQLSKSEIQGPIVLVESGLLRLQREPLEQQLNDQKLARQLRIAALESLGSFNLIHISDEEGLDGDELYAQLPPQTTIWRNFWHKRFDDLPALRTFPIGPRDVFLSEDLIKYEKASNRQYPWTFIGTIWSSGSRREAVSIFQKDLPKGFYYGAKSFGQGLPLNKYRNQLLNSIFSLAPEGDRHLDTFRLWESLCCGCIPLIVDHRSSANRLLIGPHPIPVFATWQDALCFAKNSLQDKIYINQLQNKISKWWGRYFCELSLSLRLSLLN